MKIKKYGPFVLREDLNDKESELNTKHGISFISDPKGNDWYTVQKKFAADTLKIIYDESGLIVSASRDASALWPLSFYVAEITDIPEGFTLPVPGDSWVFDGKTITVRVYSDSELTEQAAQQRANTIAAATVVIAPLQDAVELGRASDSDKARLLAWKNYRIDLDQLDISVPSAIRWPEPPEDVA